VADYETVAVNMENSTLNGYFLTKSLKNPAKANKDVLMICETVTKFDKRRIFLRSSIQVFARV
jgi:hypothetical protein